MDLLEFVCVCAHAIISTCHLTFGQLKFERWRKISKERNPTKAPAEKETLQ